MFRISLASLLVLFLGGCDCQRSSFDPKDAFASWCSESASRPTERELSQFKSSLSGLSREELSQILGALDQSEDGPTPNRQHWIEAAHHVVDEFWGRKPDAIELFRFLDEGDVTSEYSTVILSRLAKTDPQKTWAFLQELYQIDYKSGMQGFVYHMAIPFVSHLQKENPNLALSFLEPLLVSPTYETFHLKSDALSAILASMEHPDEAITLINWLRRNEHAKHPVGFLGVHRDFLKVDPRDRALSYPTTNSLIILAKLSPSRAEEWLRQNKKSNTLPERWVTAYIIGISRIKKIPMKKAVAFVDELGGDLADVQDIPFFPAGYLEEILEKIRTGQE